LTAGITLRQQNRGEMGKKRWGHTLGKTVKKKWVEREKVEVGVVRRKTNWGLKATNVFR